MRKHHNYLVPLIAATLVIVACQGSKESPTPPRAEPAPKPTLKVLGVFPMTGPGASLGEYLQNGTDLAREEIARLYPDLEVKLEVIDSKNQPKEGITALQASLARSKPDAIICAMSSVSKAVVPLVEQQGITTIVTTTALTDLPKGTKKVVRVYPTSEDFVVPVATYMSGKLDRVGALYVNDDFGDSNQRIFNDVITKAGKQVVGSEPFELAEADTRSVVARLMSRSPQAVFVTGYGPAFVGIFKSIREASADVPIFTEIGFANPAVLAGVGDVAEGITFDGTEMELSEATTPAAKAFRDTYRSRFGGDPYQVAGFAHDALVLLARASMAGASYQAPTKAGVIALSPYRGVMGAITFDAEGESRIPLSLMRREGGRTVPLQGS